MQSIPVVCSARLRPNLVGPASYPHRSCSFDPNFLSCFSSARNSRTRAYSEALVQSFFLRRREFEVVEVGGREGGAPSEALLVERIDE